MEKSNNMSDQIEKKLVAAFAPRKVQVEDVSEAHRGHAGFQEGGESHFDVIIEADHFKGMTRIAQHRAVHAALGKGIMSTIHALALKVSA